MSKQQAREDSASAQSGSFGKTISVNAASGPYAVVFGRGVVTRLGGILSGLRECSSVFLLSSPRVFKHWGRLVERGLRELLPPQTHLFNDGEQAKTLRTVERLCRKLAQGGADRRSVIVALGGGVVGDVAGFVAANYARGIRVVHVPTTLMAQVDSSIGGKTGVNLPEGKNLVGAFHQPRIVVTDPQFLKTLAAREYRSGLFEVIKYGIIGDYELFQVVEKQLADLLRREPAALDFVIERSVRAKAEIVGMDERESGERMVLNFGHTAGHALEAATRYRRFLHGEAVGWGMMAAARISVAADRLKAEDADRICALILRVGRIPPVAGVSPTQLLKHMRRDKKSVGGKLRFVLARQIGKVEINQEVPEEKVLAALRGMLANTPTSGPGAGA